MSEEPKTSEHEEGNTAEEEEMSSLEASVISEVLKSKMKSVVQYLCLFLFFPGIIMSQIPPLSQGFHSLDMPPDPRIVAMGESFAGMRSNVFASVSNPASLANVKGVHVKYSQRNADWLEDSEMKHQSALATISTSIVNVGFFYNRFTPGNFILNIEPDVDGAKIKLYDYTYGVTLARSFGESFSIGTTFKTFINKAEIKSSSSSPLRVIEYSTPFLFDLGSTYSMNVIGASATHFFTFGAALQNIGAEYNVKNQPVTPSRYYVLQDAGGIKLPRYLRVGTSYEFLVIPSEAGLLSPFGLLVTGEYRRILNYDTNNDYWGLGLETSIYQILDVRLGWFFNATGGVYGEGGAPTLRYGIGLNVPFKHLGLSIPVGVRADYGAIPYASRILSVFSMELSYEQDLF